MVQPSRAVNNANTTVEIALTDNRDTVPTTLLTLTGANVASPSFSSSEDDLSSFEDGLIMPKGKVSVDTSYAISGVYTDNPAFRDVLWLAGGDTVADAVKEIYCSLTYQNGDKDTFYALVTNYSEDGEQRKYRRFSCTFNVQTNVTRTFANPTPAS